MANTFTLQSAAYNGRYLLLECVQNPNVAGNYSDIAWTLTVTGGSSNYYSTGPTEVKIAGTQVYSCPRKAYTSKTFPAAKEQLVVAVFLFTQRGEGGCQDHHGHQIINHGGTSFPAARQLPVPERQTAGWSPIPPAGCQKVARFLKMHGSRLQWWGSAGWMRC